MEQTNKKTVQAKPEDFPVGGDYEEFQFKVYFYFTLKQGFLTFAFSLP